MKQFQQLDQLMQPQSNYLNYRHGALCRGKYKKNDYFNL